MYENYVIWPWYLIYLIYNYCVIWSWYLIYNKSVIWSWYIKYDKSVIWHLLYISSFWGKNRPFLIIIIGMTPPCFHYSRRTHLLHVSSFMGRLHLSLLFALRRRTPCDFYISRRTSFVDFINFYDISFLVILCISGVCMNVSADEGCYMIRTAFLISLMHIKRHYRVYWYFI